MPLRLFHRSMSATKSSGSSRAVELLEEGHLRMGRRDHDIGPDFLARLQHARRSRGRCARGCAATGASVRTTAPNDSAALRSASLTAPIPPRGKPHDASWPSPMSPILWCAITNAVPAERGPAHVPMIAADREHTLHLRRLEVLVEEVGDARREEPGDVADRADVEASQLQGEASLIEEIARTLRTQLRRDRGEQRAERAGEAPEPGVPALEHGVGIGARELRRSARAGARDRRSGSWR